MTAVPNWWTDHRVAVRWTVSVGSVAGLAVLGVVALGQLTVITAATSVLAAALLVGGFWLFRTLARFLGRATAAAALSLLGATALGAIALVSPQCPDALDAGRCTTAEVAGWALAGALLPAGYVLALAVPLLLIAAVGKGGRKAMSTMRRGRS